MPYVYCVEFMNFFSYTYTISISIFRYLVIYIYISVFLYRRINIYLSLHLSVFSVTVLYKKKGCKEKPAYSMKTHDAKWTVFICSLTNLYVLLMNACVFFVSCVFFDGVNWYLVFCKCFFSWHWVLCIFFYFYFLNFILFLNFT